MSLNGLVRDLDKLNRLNMRGLTKKQKQIYYNKMQNADIDSNKIIFFVLYMWVISAVIVGIGVTTDQTWIVVSALLLALGSFIWGIARALS